MLHPELSEDWGGAAHVGIAGFVASHIIIKEMESRGAKGFLIAFSSGVGYVGIARLFNLYPFNQVTKT